MVQNTRPKERRNPDSDGTRSQACLSVALRPLSRIASGGGGNTFHVKRNERGIWTVAQRRGRLQDTRGVEHVDFAFTWTGPDEKKIMGKTKGRFRVIRSRTRDTGSNGQNSAS